MATLSFLVPILGAFDRTGTFPPDVVLTYFADEADALQDISDVVDSALLDEQVLDRVVKIERLFVCSFEQVDELFSQFNKAVFFSTTPTRVVAEVALRVHAVRIVHVIGSSPAPGHALAIMTVVAPVIVVVMLIFLRARHHHLTIASWLFLSRRMHAVR